MNEISVILTTYLHGKYIRASIESVLEQTFKDFELIIIDDESPDNTEEEVSKLKDKRIKYIRQNHSGLPAKTRNKGIEMATGRLIAFLDGDDTWHPEKLHKCYEAFRKHPEVDLVCHDELMKDITGKIIKKLSHGPYVHNMFRKLLFTGNCLSPSATVVKREALMEEGLLFREDHKFALVEDYDLWLRLSSRYRFYFLPEVLGEFLWHDKNASGNFEKHYVNLMNVIKNNFNNYEEKKTSDFFLINFRISRIHFVLFRLFARNIRIKESFLYLSKALLRFFAIG